MRFINLDDRHSLDRRLDKLSNQIEDLGLHCTCVRDRRRGFHHIGIVVPSFACPHPDDNEPALGVGQAAGCLGDRLLCVVLIGRPLLAVEVDVFRLSYKLADGRRTLDGVEKLFASRRHDMALRRLRLHLRDRCFQVC